METLNLGSQAFVEKPTDHNQPEDTDKPKDPEDEVGNSAQDGPSSPNNKALSENFDDMSDHSSFADAYDDGYTFGSPKCGGRANASPALSLAELVN